MNPVDIFKLYIQEFWHYEELQQEKKLWLERSVLSKVICSRNGRCQVLIPFTWVYRAREVNWQRPPLNTRNTVSIDNDDHSFYLNLLLQRLVC